MAAPTSYDEAGFKAYLHGRAARSGVADAFGWSIEAGSYDDVVVEALLAYGAAEVSEATDVAKLRALGGLALWQAAREAAVLEVDYSADGTSFSREAIFAHIEALLAQARLDALPYQAALDYSVDILSVAHRDPYGALDL